MLAGQILSKIKQKIAFDRQTILNMDIGKLAEYIHQFQLDLAHDLGLSGEIRKVNVDTLRDLLERKDNKGSRFFFRHGDQDFANPEKLDEADKKIRMMQLPDNDLNPVTPLSLLSFSRLRSLS